ncbi:hypothetical protein FC40_GL000271 [Ligilactobacillus hayakitensis DSM 18933 = JCM 14209]|uniref:Nucleotide pyrophosphohydrolase n=1 Tax=Ligilactobacillus hayakitensis DSM 18933 = JCM 14209 TaxID=1423755 RepID=A0A0R1WNM2_9LACO|nr:nucleotide pyrophosphohydrolase [Ligilactobacillus hayakitensis]KRM19343.1 hypothetical protein FC40_GL000271 [Ligilactobacillus hayakitensis DSM 18933 = JCM 14209]
MDNEIIKKLIEFRDEREWSKYHTLKNLAISVNLEASEILEFFQWKDDLENDEKEQISEEIADTLIYLLYMCEKLDVNPNEIILNKIMKNKQRKWEKLENDERCNN